MGQEDEDDPADRIAELEAERRTLVALSIAYDQLLDRLVRTRRYRLAQAIGNLISAIPKPLRSALEQLARAAGAKALMPARSKTDRTELERDALQHRLHGVLFTDAAPAVEELPPATPATPPVSVVSVLYNSRLTVLPFLQAFHNQDYAGPIEIVLVDDASTDDGASIASTFAGAARGGLRTVRVVRNERNLGNCVSRNRGVAAAIGDVICILDADCIVNEGFVAAHVARHASGCDAVIGPMGIETMGRPVAPLMARLLADRSELQASMHLQDASRPESAVNCVTRNFSISRRVVERLGRELFDPRFTYRAAPDTGYGWEDVEMGATLRQWGARFGFTWNAISIHLSHDSPVSERTRSLGSARNFAMLIESHPQLLREARDWAITTANRIEFWGKSSGVDPMPHLGPVLDQLHASKARASLPVCVYSAAAGGYQPSSLATGRRSVIHRLFTDGDAVRGWEMLPFDQVDSDPVRTAKKPKVLPNLYLDDSDWSVWIDANITLLADPHELVAEVKKAGCLIGAFRHPERDCAYDEALRCISAGKDDPETILAQIRRYRDEGFPTKLGLAECNVLVRCHSDPAVAIAMRRWWDEIEAGSRRDQISFNYALWHTGLGYHQLGGGHLDVRTDPRFRYEAHATAAEPDAAF